MESARRRTRQLIWKILKTSSELDSFMLDNFPAVWQQFSSGMQQDLRLNLLFERYTVRQIVAKLEDYDTEKILKQELVEFSDAELDGLLPADASKPEQGAARRSSKLRDLTMLAFGILLWEKLRSFLSLFASQARSLSKNFKVQVLAGVGLLLVAAGTTILNSQRPSPDALNDMQVSDASSRQPGAGVRQARQPSISPGINQEARGNMRASDAASPAPETQPKSDKAGAPTTNDLSSPRIAKKEAHPAIAVMPIAPPKIPTKPSPAVAVLPEHSIHNPDPKLRADAASGAEGMSTPSISNLAHAEPPPDMARGPAAQPKVAREPSLLVCPERIAIQIDPGSDTKLDPRHAAEQLIAEMKSQAASPTKVVALPTCSGARGEMHSIQIGTTLRIQNKIIESKPQCPIGSKTDCYKSVKREITCRFTFIIIDHPPGYVCGKMKSDPPIYEYHYYENEIDVPKWSARRRGEVALDNCRHLARVLAKENLCQPL